MITHETASRFVFFTNRLGLRWKSCHSENLLEVCYTIMDHEVIVFGYLISSSAAVVLIAHAHPANRPSKGEIACYILRYSSTG